MAVALCPISEEGASGTGNTVPVRFTSCGIDFKIMDPLATLVTDIAHHADIFLWSGQQRCDPPPFF
jgi:hypothetical protein